MYFNVPVVADASGGPLETVGKSCGYVCRKEEDWVESMKLSYSKVIDGRAEMLKKFSFINFQRQFISGIDGLYK